MGTTAQKLQAIVDSKADIADAIEEKGGTVPATLAEYGDAIRAIPSGGFQEPADVEFIDYDGTVLHKYTFAEALALTELPSYSDRPGYGTGYTLTNEGWNYTLAEIQRHAQAGIKVTVGCTYVTSDSATRIHVHIDDQNDRKFGFAIAQKTSRTVHIAWGDPNDTSDDQTPGTQNYILREHTYSTTGDFTITLTNETSTPTIRFQKNLCQGIMNYCDKVVAFELGPVDQFYGDSSNYCGGVLAHCDNIEYLSVPSAVVDHIGTAACMRMLKLKALVVARDGSSSYVLKHHCFAGCISLEKVSIPACVTQIGTSPTDSSGGNVFQGCTSLKYVSIPDSVTETSKNAFSDCPSMGMVYWNGIPGLHGNAFRYSGLKEIRLNTSTSGGSHDVGGSDFYGCSSLERVTTGTSSTIAATGDACFQSCMRLESVPEVTVVSANMFNACYSLKRIKVTTSTAIGANAFRYSGLREIDLSGCATVPALGSSALSDMVDDFVLIVPNGQLSAWQQATDWSSYASHMVEASA